MQHDTQTVLGYLGGVLLAALLAILFMSIQARWSGSVAMLAAGLVLTDAGKVTWQRLVQGPRPGRLWRRKLRATAVILGLFGIALACVGSWQLLSLL